MTEHERAIAVLEKCLVEIGEHFEVVQIFVSYVDETGTFSGARGSGNWYARKGLAQEFINQDTAQEIADAIARRMRPKDEC